MAKKGNAALAFAGGLATGYMKAARQQKDDGLVAEDRAMRKEEHDARMAENNEKRQTRMGLADAARPVSVEQGAGGMSKPETMDNRDVGLAETAGQPNGGLDTGAYRVKGKVYADQAGADAAAATQNSPEAVAQRQAQVLRSAGRPGDAAALEQNQLEHSQKQLSYANKLREEGVLQVGRALRGGDAQEVFETFNASGKQKLDGLPTATPVEMDVPGIGKVKAFEWAGNVIGADGKAQPVKINSHDFSLKMLPYEKLLETQRKGSDSERKYEHQGAVLDAKTAALDAKTAAAAAKVGKGGAGATREERLRYTSLFSDAGRRAGEAQKAITALQKDPEFARGLRRDPAGPQAQELATLRESLKSHNEERTMYQGMLAGEVSKPAGGPGLADAKPRAGAAADAPKSVKTKAERDALPKGTRYTGPDGQSYVKQ